jgi:hypothetical protein
MHWDLRLFRPGVLGLGGFAAWRPTAVPSCEGLGSAGCQFWARKTGIVYIVNISLNKIDDGSRVGAGRVGWEDFGAAGITAGYAAVVTEPSRVDNGVLVGVIVHPKFVLTNSEIFLGTGEKRSPMAPAGVKLTPEIVLHP